MKTILSLSALLITLTLTAQSNTATWYLNDTSGNGIQSQSSTASGSSSRALGTQTTASGDYSTALGNNAQATGNNATALGNNTTASGYISTAMGQGTEASGNDSTAMGSYTTASGIRSTAMGYQTTASGEESTAMGYQTTASGAVSTAMGVGTTASGNMATAMGQGTEASGGISTAMGSYTTASGDYSTATGASTTATGDYSTAMGVGTIASDYTSLVVGQYNLLGSTVTNSATQFSTDNTAFVIGNGTSNINSNRSDALTVLFDGTTNVAGSVTATAFIGDGSQLTNLPTGTGGGNSPFSLNTTSGTGIQSETNTASGDYSTATGASTTATGDYSTAMGGETIASGYVATAIGAQTEASGYYSTAMGLSTTASGQSSTAMGYNTTANESNSTAMGSTTTASGETSTAMGYGTVAQGHYSTTMGYETTATNFHSTAMGRKTYASGINSTAMGYYTTASDRSSLVIGEYNLLGSTVTNNATDFSLENTAFVIGNGADADNKSDALTVLFDGTTNVAGSVTATAFIGDGSQLTNLPTSGGDSPLSYNNNQAGGIEIADYTTASGSRAFAVGNDNLASGSSSTAMGRGTIASGDDSTALGANTEASGERSTSLGYKTTASDRSSLVVGQYNLLGSTVTNSATQFSLDNTAFVIGNGVNLDNRSDALTVLFDGTTTIAGDLNLNSDARLKANIISLGSTLAKLLQIDGKTYTMKKDENKKQKIGVLAQDIEKVFPELVSESNGVKSVNYQGLVPVLINALKEQDNKMNEQEARIERLEKLLLDS
jgi:hypothetical protein